MTLTVIHSGREYPIHPLDLLEPALLVADQVMCLILLSPDDHGLYGGECRWFY